MVGETATADPIDWPLPDFDLTDQIAPERNPTMTGLRGFVQERDGTKPLTVGTPLFSSKTLYYIREKQGRYVIDGPQPVTLLHEPFCGKLYLPIHPLVDEVGK